VLALAAAGGGTSIAADYDASVTGTEPESDDVQLRTVERRPGHWYVRIIELDLSIRCENGREHYVLASEGDVSPRELPIRRARFRGTLRLVYLDLEPFLASATYVVSGRFGRQRRTGRRLRGRVSVRTVGEGGTECRGIARFAATRPRV